MKNIYWDIFTIFARIGAFTIGGGWAMIPLIEREVVDSRKWIDKEEFVDALALVQIVPGLLAMNTAIFVGYRIKGFRGCLAAMLGSALPSFVIILGIVMFLGQFQAYPAVEAVFKGVRPVVISLILIPAINTARAAKINRVTILIPIVTAILICLIGLSPVYMVLGGALGGVLYYKFKAEKI